MPSPRLQLDRCLAYVAACNPREWLGEAFPSALAALLHGAHERARLAEQSCAMWRIFGPLEHPSFYEPLISRTGRPGLTIKWATALELHHYCPSDAMDELRSLIEDWAPPDDFDAEERIPLLPTRSKDPIGQFWKQLQERPAMFLGDLGGWKLHCFLKGMDAGGDWLDLPQVPGVRERVETIARFSRESYGSDFAAYRVYRADGLLAKVREIEGGWGGLRG